MDGAEGEVSPSVTCVVALESLCLKSHKKRRERYSFPGVLYKFYVDNDVKTLYNNLVTISCIERRRNLWQERDIARPLYGLLEMWFYEKAFLECEILPLCIR